MKLAVLLLLCLIGIAHSFVPASVMREVLYKLDGRFEGNLGKVSESLTHDEILKRGVIQSVVNFLHDQPGGAYKINLTKMNEYYDVRKLYFDYYGKGLCNNDIPFFGVVEDMQAAAASVDFSSSTKDLPYAHFDAEKFRESNARVIEFIRRVNFDVEYNDFEEARQKSGQILHTIQDFYSHSNWVETGNTQVQDKIGKPEFDQLPTSLNIDRVCDNSTSACKLIEEDCGYLASFASFVLNNLGFTSSFVSCPLKYYNCTDNILAQNVLVSGYYSGQETNDGLEVNKPEGQSKCSHGGILDGSSFIQAEGGINKDSGYTLFSPHALLHLQAADLAIAHTKKFYDDIKLNHGADRYNKMLEIFIDNSTLAKFGNVPCSSSMIKANLQIVSLVFISVNILINLFK